MNNFVDILRHCLQYFVKNGSGTFLCDFLQYYGFHGIVSPKEHKSTFWDIAIHV